jgi:hypothetical protein
MKQQQKICPPPFVFYFKKLVAVEILTISILFIIASIFYITDDSTIVDPIVVYELALYLYAFILLIKILIKCIKVLFTPNS